MAKKKNQPTRTKLEDFNDQLTGVEQKLEKNKKLVFGIGGGLVAVALIVWGIFAFYINPQHDKANKQNNEGTFAAMLRDDDSTALKSFEAAAKNFSNAEGNMAHLYAASILYKMGTADTVEANAKKCYEQALAHLEKYDPKGNIVGPASQNLKASCLINLGKYEEAVSALDEAIKMSKDNRDYAPLFMFKKAQLLESDKLKNKVDEAIKVYEDIMSNYPQIAEQLEVEKYLERARAKKG
ncbi:MAG: hypothetical protein J6X70_02955 [Muribaculaceae bacterium]|nr:hypothetical protein [Muribaculaceae bacterium]